MAEHQINTVTSSLLTLGNYQVLVGTCASYLTVASAVSSCVTNLGAGMVNSFAHVISRYEVQAGNAVDPIEGVASENFTVSGDLIEWSAAAMVSAFGGIMYTGSSDSAVTTIAAYSEVTGGGATVITPKCFILKNLRHFVTSAGTTMSGYTYIVVWKATMKNGPAITAKGDEDSDPVQTMAFELEGIIDGSRTVGDQMFRIQKWTY
jgi:hypothetical protein